MSLRAAGRGVVHAARSRRALSLRNNFTQVRSLCSGVVPLVFSASQAAGPLDRPLSASRPGALSRHRHVYDADDAPVEDCAMSPRVVDVNVEPVPVFEKPPRAPRGSSAVTGSKRGKKHPGGALDFLTTVRTELNPRGPEFLDLVRVLNYNPKGFVTASHDPLRARVWFLMHATGASSKFVLRKLASAVLPGRGKAKQAFLRDRLLLGHLPFTEKVRCFAGAFGGCVDGVEILARRGKAARN